MNLSFIWQCERCRLSLKTVVLERMLSAPRTEERRSACPSSCLCRAPNDTHALVRARTLHPVSPGTGKFLPLVSAFSAADWSSRAVSQVRAPERGRGYYIARFYRLCTFILPLSLHLCLVNIISICSFLRSAREASTDKDVQFQYSNAVDQIRVAFLRFYFGH